MGYLKEDKLILGQWKKGTPKYSEFKNNQYEILDYIEDNDEKNYYKLMLDKCLNWYKKIVLFSKHEKNTYNWWERFFRKKFI